MISYWLYCYTRCKIALVSLRSVSCKMIRGLIHADTRRSFGRPWYSWGDTRHAPLPRRRWDLSIYKCGSTGVCSRRSFVIIIRLGVRTRGNAADARRWVNRHFWIECFWLCSPILKIAIVAAMNAVVVCMAS